MNSGAEPRTSSLLRPSGARLFDRIDYRLIQTPAEKDSVYLMRYRAYLHGGLISPSESERIIDPYDDAPNAWIFGIYLDGVLCSSIRLHVLTSELRMSYTTKLFSDVLDSRLDRGEVFVDPARFAADPEKAKLFPELPYATLRLAYIACDHFNADTGLAMVRTDHQAFYRRVFLHETVSEPRAFPGWHSKKVVLMASDFREFRERVLARFPIMRSTVFEQQMLFDRNNGQVPPVVKLREWPSVQAVI
jgi:N-acyl amino acid synthase FeeM